MHTASHEARHAPTRCGQASSQGVRPVAEEIETNYRVVRLEFGRFVPSPEAPEAADQCVCVLGGLPLSPWAALSFLERTSLSARF